MAQNIYDDPKFFSGYSQLPRQVRGLAGAPEWSIIEGTLPPIEGKRVADLGCGFGWAARWMRQNGAESVVGYDLSINMLKRAREDTNDSGIDYQIADLERIDLPPHSFELIYSALAFHYIEDFGRLARMMHRALVSGGDLVFTIEHPIFMAASHASWTTDALGCKAWPVNGYAIEGERRSTWFVEGVVKYHRTMATTLNTLIGEGFRIDRVEEFAPSAAQVRENPLLAEELERPMMLIIAAHAS